MLRKLVLFAAFLLILSACSSSTLTETPTSGNLTSDPEVTEIPHTDDPRNLIGAESGTVQVELGVPFWLAVGQIGEIQGVDTDITFTHVIAESRCPSDVQCIWAGQVVVAMEIKQGGELKDEFELVLGASIEEDDSPAWELDGLIILLMDVIPYPQSTQGIEQENYRAELVVSMMEGPP